MVTTYDIAEKAGVSQATVSFVLNKRNTSVRISEKTRQRVLRAAEDLGYRRNGSAHAMSSGRFNCAALLTSTHPHHSYLPQGLLQGIHEELTAHEMHMTLAMLSDEKLTDAEFVPKILREWLSDGLLIDYIQHIPKRLVELITSHALPAVWINAKQETDCVYPDDSDAAKQATEYLIGLGHRNIAWLDFSHGFRLDEAHYSAGDRCGSYKATMEAAGLEPRMACGDALTGGGIPAIERVAFSKAYLSQTDRPTAVITYGYPEVVMVAALALGLDVPRDLSVMSFGSAEMSFAGIPITSMREPNEQVGVLSVRMLLEKIQNPGRVLPPQVVPFDFQEGATALHPSGTTSHP